MSVAEFSKAMRNKAIQEWLKREKGEGIASESARKEYSLKNTNVLVNPVSLYRTNEQTSEKTAFLITKETIKDLIQTFQGISKDDADIDSLADKYFNKFKQKNAGVSVARRQIRLDKNISAIYFPHISFESITNLVNDIMNIPSGELAKYYEKGHIVGLASELLQETTKRLSEVNTAGTPGKSYLIDQLDKVIEYYKRLDAESTNIQPYQKINIYAKYVKRASNRRSREAKYLVELQPKVVNQQSAREVQATIGTIRKLFTSANMSEKQILDLINTLKSKVSDQKFLQDLVQMESSPSMLKMIEESIISTLNGSDYTKEFSSNNVFIDTKQVPRIDTSNIKKYAKEQAAQAAKAKRTLAATKRKRMPSAVNTSLISVQKLINSQLFDTIKSNMGTGNRTDVLNYRTGRFAQSVKLERISESRQGMITAFYSYMKNPYATFSSGGRQEYPKSRDPKLLISKSIREIAQTLVSNRLRAVNV